MENTQCSHKHALIATGGGMSCCWGAGVFKALASYNYQPDLIVGISGNAGNAVYFKSGQHDVLEEIWVNYLASKKFVDPFRYPRVINIDYLIKEVLQNHFPLDVKNFNTSKCKLVVPSTSTRTGEPVWFSDWQRFDIFQILHASKAMAIGYGEPVVIENESFVDVPSSHVVRLAIKEVVNMGATHILLIDTTNPMGMIADFFKERWLKKQSKTFQRGFLSSIKISEDFIVSSGITMLHLKPRMPTSVFTRDSKKLKETFDSGFYETQRNFEVEKFIKRQVEKT